MTSKFQDSWLSMSICQSWLTKIDNNTARCKPCGKNINLAKMDKAALDSHSGGKAHQMACTAPAQTIAQSFSQGGKCQQKIPTSIQASNAEIIWAHNLVKSHLSLRSLEGQADVFPDSEIAKVFHMAKTKGSYLINFGLAPFYKEKLQCSLSMSPYIAISFDESLNHVTQNDQMDIITRFWNSVDNRVETRYYDSKFFHRPNADTLFNNLSSGTSDLNAGNFNGDARKILIVL